MRRTPSAAATALLLGLLVAGCARPPAPEPLASDEERSALQAAERTMGRDPAAAEEALQDFIQRWPQSALADDAALHLAELAQAADEPERARHWLGYILRSYPDSDQSDLARLRLARLEFERGDLESARRLLSRLRFSRLGKVEQRQAYRLLADSATDPVERLRWLAPLREAALAAEETGEVAQADREIDALLDRMAAEDLERAAEQLERRIPAGRVHLRLAERALDAGDFKQAERELGQASRFELAPEYRETREQLRVRLELRSRIASEADGLPGFAEVAALPAPRTEGAHGTLGVVLPLSGPFAAYGEESLRGILLATRIFDESKRLQARGEDASPAADRRPAAAGLEGPGRLRVLVRDSRGQAAVAAAAVRDLAREDDLVAVVGPLLFEESRAAAAAAQEEGVPLLSLTDREEVPRDKSFVFRLRTTPHDEVRYLVSYAVDKLGARRFAILYPGDNYGRGMRKEFWRAVDERGGWVTAVSSYEPDATDFAEPIRRMIGYPLLTPDEKKALEEREKILDKARRMEPAKAAVAREEAYAALGPEGEPLPPIVDFDALFIPDSYDKVVLITPQLAFHEITDVQLLGSGEWNDPKLVRIAREHVRGAIISAPFYAESGFVFVSDFVERYTTTFGATPDVFAAQAFDGANLVLVQLAAGRSSRDDVRDGLLGTQAYPGVSGVTSFLPDGNARKRPYLLAVRRGRIVSID
jgi:branched-chain amino acid transport system substrate-binding protein